MQLNFGRGFKQLLKTVETAFKTLHKRGKYKPEDLDQVPEYKNIVSETTNILNRAFKDNDLSEEMLNSLQEDVFYFSSLKTHAQLFEASRQILTEDKKIKSFAQFNNDVKGIKESHRQYLEAEYEFAVGSVQMVDRWESFSDGSRYYLQYRTAADNRVRDSHAALHNITLPKNHSFWDLYFAPNGWRCRCTVVQVLASSNKQSDGNKALKKGNEATTQIDKNGKNKLEIFRFNPAKKKVVFPPKHPYKKVAGAAKVKSILKNKKDA